MKNLKILQCTVLAFYLTVSSHLSCAQQRDNFTFVTDTGANVTIIYEDDPDFHILTWEELKEYIGFYLYTARSNPSLAPKRLYLDDLDSIRNSGFNPNIPTKILIHGLGNTLQCDMIQTIKNTYLKSDYYNVIGVEWCTYSGGCFTWVPFIFYAGAKANTIMVGNYVAKFLAFFTREAKVRLEDLHLIGYSLGAHVAGIAGRTIVVDTSHYFGRITGLDPAGTWYPKKDDPEDYNELRWRDANFVDVIHTDCTRYGLDYNVGHVDFFVYGGFRQPGCSWYKIGCDHAKSFKYFEEAIREQEKYLAFECDNLETARNPKGINCLSSATLFMGEKLNNESQGIYFVKSPNADCVKPNARDLALANRRLGPSLFAEGCSISIPALHDQHPLLLRPREVKKDVGLYLPHEKAGLFNVNFGDIILLACPGDDNNLVLRSGKSVKEINATCNGGTSFEVDGCSYDIAKLPCFITPAYTERRGKLDKKCDSKGGFMIEVGFLLAQNDFLRTMDICFNDRRKIALWSKYKLQPGIRDKAFVIDARALGPTFDQGPFYPNMNVNNRYKKNTQLVTVTTILGSKTRAKEFIKDDEYYFLSRGHLSANADFVYKSQKLSTYLYVNAAPQWQIFNGGNWASMEEDVRNYAGKNNLLLTVYTGTLGVMTLPTEEQVQKEIWLSVAPQSIPVPRLFWKVVYNESTEKAIAFIGTNNPYVSQTEAGQVICNDICDQISMPLTWDRSNLQLGYSYCCAVDDELKKLMNLPDDVNVSGVLTAKVPKPPKDPEPPKDPAPPAKIATSLLACDVGPVRIKAIWRDMRDDCVRVLTSQVQSYMEAAVTYLAMGAHFAREEMNRPGFSSLFFARATEKREAAILIIKQLSKRGELTHDLNHVIRHPKPLGGKTAWWSGLEALQDSLKLEVAITRNIHRVIATCEDSEGFNDFQIVKYLKKSFLAPQREAERELARKIVDIGKAAYPPGTMALTEFLYDKKLLAGFTL